MGSGKQNFPSKSHFYVIFKILKVFENNS